MKLDCTVVSYLCSVNQSEAGLKQQKNANLLID